MPRTLDEWLAHCESIHPKEIDLTLERVRTVYRRLAIAFDVPVVSVAGTNGKGSSCAMLESIARHAGWRVGLHIKPHLVDFTERCRIDGENVAPDVLAPHFEAVEAARDCLTGADRTKLKAVYLASTTLPFQDRHQLGRILSVFEIEGAVSPHILDRHTDHSEAR